MPLSKTDRQRIKDIKTILTGPLSWNRTTIQRINGLSPDTLTTALEIGRLLDVGLRRKHIQLTQKSLDAEGVNLPVERAKIFVQMATHKSNCEEGPRYRDRRRYGTREGEQAVVKRIRHLFTKGRSYREIAETLRLTGHLPRKGTWNPKTIWSIIKNAEQGAKRYQPCTCRMFRDDWVPPCKWSVYWEMSRLSDRLFEGMLEVRRNHYNTTIADIRTFRQSLVAPPAYLPPADRPDRSHIANINTVVFGDCRQRILELPDDSISLVVTSPPYGKQRDGKYAGSPPAEYPEFTISWMGAMKPKLKEDGSVLIIIRPEVEDGVEADYVERTIDALVAAGWILIQRSIWYKPNAGPFGALDRPRRTYEFILWFAKSTKPYVNLTAGSHWTNRKGRSGTNRHGLYHSTSDNVGEGYARASDVIIAPISGLDGVNHPAMFPPDLIRHLIPPYAPPGSLIVDPFAGAGTTCLVAQSLDFDCWGCDNGYEIIGYDNDKKPIYGDSYATMANRRLANEVKYARGAAVEAAASAKAKGAGAST